MKNRQALIITGKLVQDHEYIYPYYRVKEDGYEVDVATPDGLETTGQLGTKVLTTLALKDVSSLDKYSLMILPGGAKCMEYLRQDPLAIKLIKDFHDKGGIIASICHAGQLLISAKIVRGRRIAAYYSLKDDVQNAGAIYVDEPAVIDGNIVTTAHYKDLGPWMKAALGLVK